MSRSTSFRALALTPEARAEAARLARAARLAERLLPALARQASERIDLASGAGLLTSSHGEQLRRRLGAALDVHDLRAVMTAVPISAALAQSSSSLPHDRTMTIAPSAGVTPKPSQQPGESVAPRGVVPATTTSGRIRGSGSLPTAAALRPAHGRLPSSPTGKVPSSAGTPDTRHLRLAQMLWELTEERTRLDVLVAEAHELGVDVHVDASGAGALIAAAQRYADARAIELLRSQLDAAAARISHLEDTVDAARADVAARRSTLDLLQAIAQDQMGFAARVVDPHGDPAVEGAAADGRTIRLHLETQGDREVLVTAVTDIGNALPSDDDRAGELCEPSISTAAQLHRIIDSTAAFEAGRVSVKQTPKRGLPGVSRRPTPAALAAQRATTPKARTKP